VFSPQGPSFRELCVQALSSVERGYDLLAPKFDHTPFRTPGAVLDATVEELAARGPFGRGVDVCCGTGAGLGVLERLCPEGITGVDFSAGMLAQARTAYPDAALVQADARALPFGAEPGGRSVAALGSQPGGEFGAEPGGQSVAEVGGQSGGEFGAEPGGQFDLAVTFGALGHFLPAERPALFTGVHRALRPGGLFAFAIGSPPPVTSVAHWALLGFDVTMRIRNAVIRPPFVMYYRTTPLRALTNDLTAAGFTVESIPLTALGERPDGTPHCRLILARKPADQPRR
jgi:SAM-dependent methyltransferase